MLSVRSIGLHIRMCRITLLHTAFCLTWLEAKAQSFTWKNIPFNMLLDVVRKVWAAAKTAGYSDFLR